LDLGGYMKFTNCFIIVFVLIATVIIGGCDVRDNTDTQIFKNITILEAVELIEDNANNTRFTILDVRTSEEFNEGHIEDAINLDFYSDTFSEELDRLDKDNTYFRSRYSSEYFLSLIYRNKSLFSPPLLLELCPFHHFLPI